MMFDYPLGIAMSTLYAMLALVSLTTMPLRNKRDCQQLCAQINSWWRIFPFVTGALLFYPLGLAALAILVCMLSIRELALHAGDLANRFRVQATVLVLFIIPCGYVQPAILFFLIVGIGSLGVLLWVSHSRIVLLWILFGSTLLCGIILTQLTALSLEERVARSWIFFLFVLTALNDIGQFVFGKLFGKRKIIPSISPNKTWGGLFGGIGASVLVSLLLGLWLELGSPFHLIIIAIILALSGFLGDIIFSAAKRFIGVKDFSNLLPGHGGILDRIDSLILTAPVFYGILSIFY